MIPKHVQEVLLFHHVFFQIFYFQWALRSQYRPNLFTFWSFYWYCHWWGLLFELNWNELICNLYSRFLNDHRWFLYSHHLSYSPWVPTLRNLFHNDFSAWWQNTFLIIIPILCWLCSFIRRWWSNLWQISRWSGRRYFHFFSLCRDIICISLFKQAVFFRLSSSDV